MKRDDEEYFKKIQDYVDTTKTVATDVKEFLINVLNPPVRENKIYPI
jgi:hypothetical protein